MGARTMTCDNVAVFCAFDEMRPIESLVEHPANTNQHPERQIALLAKVIYQQGWRAPITVSNRSGYIVRGHGRLAAARLLACAEVPVDFQDYEDEAHELADLIADNRIAELGHLDLSATLDLVQSLDDGDFDLELTGFDEASLDALLGGMDDGAEPPSDGGAQTEWKRLAEWLAAHADPDAFPYGVDSVSARIDFARTASAE